MKITKIKCLALAFSTILGLEGYAVAHGMGPHGGHLVDIAPYHMEFQVMPGMLHLYVIDKDQKAMPLEGKATGKLILQMPDGTKKTMDLEAKGDNFMVMADIKPEVPFTAVATVQWDGQTHTARFENVAQESPHDGHQDEHHEEANH